MGNILSRADAIERLERLIDKAHRLPSIRTHVHLNEHGYVSYCLHTGGIPSDYDALDRFLDRAGNLLAEIMNRMQGEWPKLEPHPWPKFLCNPEQSSLLSLDRKVEEDGTHVVSIGDVGVAVDPEYGQLIIETLGKRHTIRCGADPISQRAVVHHDVGDLPKCKKRESRNGTINQALSSGGTMIRVEWGERQDEWPFGDLNPTEDDFADQFRELVQGFAVFNPHLTLTLNWFGKRTAWKATDPTWNKWKPNKPTSPHWYELAHLERLVGAYVTHDRDNATDDRLVSDLIAEFDGLSGSRRDRRFWTIPTYGASSFRSLSSMATWTDHASLDC